MPSIESVPVGSDRDATAFFVELPPAELCGKHVTLPGVHGKASKFSLIPSGFRPTRGLGLEYELEGLARGCTGPREQDRKRQRGRRRRKGAAVGQP